MVATRVEELAGIEGVDLRGVTALVTGGTAGIGRETALALGRLGATVLVQGRDRERGEAVLAELRDSSPGDTELYLADFETMATVEQLGSRIRAEHDKLDVLVNNAGGYFGSGALTEDGIERTFAVNHLAPFVLTLELLPSLRAGSGRVVTVSSEAHRRGELPAAVRPEETPETTEGEANQDGGSPRLNPESFRTVSDYGGWPAYTRSKLANVLFTVELAERLDPASITTNCCHPGVVPGSGFTRNMIWPARAAAGLLGRLPSWPPTPFVDTPREASATQTYLAGSPELADVSGTYFMDCEPKTPDERARDAGLRQALWNTSVELADVDRSVVPKRPER